MVKLLPAVLAQDQLPVRLEDAVRIFRIDDQFGEVERTPDHPGALVALVPGRAAVIGNKERAIGGFDKSVNPLCIRRRDRDRDPAIRLFRKTFGVLGSDFRPGRAAIGRAEQAAGGRFVGTVAAGAEGPAFAPEIPHGRKHFVRVGGIERDVGTTGGEVRAFQREVPGLAAIRRLVEPAIRRIAPERARHGRENRIAARRTDDDVGDAFRIRQTGMGPGLAAIGRFVDSVADRDAVARPRFARADPDVLRILGIERDGADRLHRLLVEDRLVARPAILGFPNAAAGRSDVKGEFPGRFPEGGKGGDAAAHGRGADVARAKAGDGRRIVGRLFGADGCAGQTERGEKDEIRETHKSYLEAGVGNLNSASSTGTFASAFSKTIFCLSADPLGPASIENGKNTPAIFS